MKGVEDFKAPREWGVKLSPLVKYGGFGGCPWCNHLLDRPYNYVVGFTRTTKAESWRVGEKICGTLILQCPRCSNLSWIHAGVYTSIIHYRKRVISGLETTWPKDKDGKPY